MNAPAERPALKPKDQPDLSRFNWEDALNLESLLSEEERMIRPLVARLAAEGIVIRGPMSADTMFHAAARKTYDAAICAYHDQALIPIKTIDFAGGVNVTLGLPFVRTSPDHGTAHDIAGRGIADPSSLIAALRMAREMAAARRV